jgi:hypothetical protein
MPLKKTDAQKEFGITRQTFGLLAAEPLARLRGLRGIKTYTQMIRNSPIISAALTATTMLIRRVDWRVDSDIPNDPRAEFVEQCMGDMSHSWNDHISQALTMLPYGFAWFEVIYKKRSGAMGNPSSQYNDGRLGWRRFSLRAQDTMHPTDPWVYNDDGSLAGFRQWVNESYAVRTGKRTAVIPIEKSVLYRTQVQDGNPEGVSVLRPAYRSWFFGSQLEEIEAIGHERNLAGLPSLRLDPNAPQSQVADLSDGTPERDAAEALLRHVRNDEEAGVLTPPGWLFELLSGGDGGKASSIADTIVRHENRISLTMLAGFILLGTHDVGSFALAKAQAELFYATLNAWADIISDTLNRHTITKLLWLNGMQLEKPPRIVHDPVSIVDATMLSEYMQKLIGVGAITPTEELEDWLLSVADAPNNPSYSLQSKALVEAQEDTGAEEMSSTPCGCDDIEHYAVTPLTEWDSLDKPTQRDILATGREIMASADTNGRVKRVRQITADEWARVEEQERALMVGEL